MTARRAWMIPSTIFIDWLAANLQQFAMKVSNASMENASKCSILQQMPTLKYVIRIAIASQ
jgi:hypothetical protein